MDRLTVSDYFKKDESLYPTELVYGIVREPPAPVYGHQSLVTHLSAMLDRHVREHDLGRVCVSPVDVVLDEMRALVVQPDIVVVAREHVARIRERILGPPDLVVEVLSPRTARRDRTTKLGWYRRYGVRECWLVERRTRSIEIVDCAHADTNSSTFSGNSTMRSIVLPTWAVTAEAVFD